MASLILRLDVGDQVIDRSTQILQQQKGWDVITPNSNLDKLGNVGRGETLIINGHGDPVSLGGYSTTKLATLLAQGGLRGPVEIQLIACETGWGGAPFALELKVALVQGQKIMCSVSAPTRYVAVEDDGSQVVANLTFDNLGNVLTVDEVTGKKSHFSTTRAF